ncbi:Crp/Fnr family transcriptional regulator [Roseobacter sinensis]|uniref:Crp/Fnr family transcriptional regulator n=1 Tax=Roseobacter sinensis TaxID=2931391 RepID=A0ABT3BIU2_9RHOB|nr:Crp/Fnr family transcriptional regulator [Roseobacter sp. WL0113]MCV3273294.1 Crp/Fnr family transcriptional regulator [Roseobacter sp. WL0113]
MIHPREEALQDNAEGAIYLSEYILDINEGSGFLAALSYEDQKTVRKMGTRCTFAKGDSIFLQGASHTGVWIIEKGKARTYYVGPTGREITLAYWTAGHFIGGPEVFGRGRHVWSADAVEDCEMVFLSGMSLQKLVREIPDVAIAVIHGLIAKGKCYSALIQMLGTRSVTERLRQFLVIFADTHGRHEGDTIIIDRTITYEQIAFVVGATRQWVTQTLDKLRAEGVLDITRSEIVIRDFHALEI